MATTADGVGTNRPPVVVSHQQAILDKQRQINEGNGSLILRIKRKRGTDPISALRIESLLSKGIDPREVGDHVQNVESDLHGSPEDQTGGSTRSKRRLTERGVFRLADTVSASSFANEAATRKLEERITELKKAAPISAASSLFIPEKSTLASASKATIESSTNVAPKASTEESLRFKIVKPQGLKEKSKKALLGSLSHKSCSNSLRSRASHQQKKFSQNISKGSVSLLRNSSEISNVSRKSPLSRSSRIRFIDAVMERTRSDNSRQSNAFESRNKVKVPLEASHDTEMALLDRRFADLLGNYLKENDMEPPTDLYDSSVVSTHQPDQQSDSEDGSDEDYVYDIYFREKETMWGFGPAGASDAGLRPSQVAGHEKDIVGLPLSSSCEIGRNNITEKDPFAMEPMATLVGFSDEDTLIAEMENANALMAQEVPGDSDDDFDEGEDEDSNDEGFYRNDYPEDEGQDDDEMNQAGWGRGGGSDSEDEENESEDCDSDLH